MKLSDMSWTQNILDMARNRDVDGLLKKGFYVICFKEGHVNVQGDLEDVGVSETEFAEYKYLQTTSTARFYDYTWKGGCITLCVPSSINSADTDIESAFEQE